MIGKTVEAVVEGFDQWAECYFGRTAGDAPDIDGKIFFNSDRKLEVGQFVNVLVDDFFVAVAGQVTVITLSPDFTGVNVIVPSVIDAVATPVVPLDTSAVAPLLHVAVNVLFVPYVPFTIVLVPLVTVVLPSFTVVVLLPLTVVTAYSTLFALY